MCSLKNEKKKYNRDRWLKAWAIKKVFSCELFYRSTSIRDKSISREGMVESDTHEVHE